MSEPCNFIKTETLLLVFSCEFCNISKNTFFIEHLQWLLLYMERQFGKILAGVKQKLKSKITKVDPYVIAWTVKIKDKLVPVVVRYIPREFEVYKIPS